MEEEAQDDESTSCDSNLLRLADRSHDSNSQAAPNRFVSCLRTVS